MSLTISKKERQRRSRQLALFNSYQSVASNATMIRVKQGRGWYEDAQKACQMVADATGHDLTTVVGTLAVLSPGTRWRDNLKSAHGALTGDWDTAWRWHAYGSTGIDKATHIVENELTGSDVYDYINTPGSFKVPEFYRSILMREGAVCVDSWIYRINKTGYLSSGPPKGYVQSATSAIRMLASQKGWTSYETQAVLWLQTRKEEQQVGYPNATKMARELLASGTDTD